MSEVSAYPIRTKIRKWGLVNRSNLIQVDTTTWIVLREFAQYPKAIIHKVVAAGGGERYMLMTWAPDPSERRMVDLHESLQAAEAAVPWPSRTPPVPPHPYAPHAEKEAYMRASGVNGNGYPRGSVQAKREEARRASNAGVP